MADCKIISATAKEPVINVNDGAKVATAEVKEIVSNVQAVSIAPTIPTGCIQTNLSGFGEEWIPDPTLFRYNEDKLVSTDFLLKEFGRGIADVAAYTDSLLLNIGKNFADTSIGSDVLTALVNWVRNVHDNGGYYSTGYGQDNSVEYQFKYIDILTVGLSKVLNEQGIATDIVSKVLSKTFTETSVASDSLAKLLQPAKVETAIASDVLTAVVDFNLTLQDWAYLTDDVLGNANVDDDQYMSMDKVILELMTYTDVLSTALTKVFSETTIGSDILALTSGKVLTDSSIATDSVTSLVNKGLVETAIGSDVLSAIASKVLSETAVGTDALGITTSKVLADSVVMSDVFDTVGWYGDTSTFTDVFSKSLSIVLADSLPISETVSKSVSISKTESAVMSEVRTANLQNYMVPLYVNAGYIGTNYSI